MTPSLAPGALARPPAAWVAELLAPYRGKALCLGGGEAREARALMRSGWTVAAAAASEASTWWHRARLERDATPSAAQLDSWCTVRREREIVRRFSAWNQHAFTPEETTWLGIWHQHLLIEGQGSERAVGIAAVFAAMRYWSSWDRQQMDLKPRVPVEVFRYYVEAFVRSRRELRGGFAGAANLAPERALSEFPSDLVYCYVPPVEGIGMLGVASDLAEQWTRGLPRPLAQRADEIFPVEGWLSVAASVPLVALGYGGDQGDRLVDLVGRQRPILRHEELQVPFPGTEGMDLLKVGLLIAGASANEGTRT